MRRSARDKGAVDAALAEMIKVARNDGNMIEPMLAAARAEATPVRCATRCVPSGASTRATRFLRKAWYPKTDLSVSPRAITLREADKPLGCARGGARHRGPAAHRNRVCAAITVLAVFVLPSGRRRQPSSITPRRLTMPLKIPAGSPTGSLLKGF